jgi:hypothetical protein
MADLLKLPVRNGDGDVHVVVETPRGSAAKLEYDPELEAFTLSKALLLGLTYPIGVSSLRPQARTVILLMSWCCMIRRPRPA